MAWDQKWLVIGSWFVRPSKKKNGKGEEVVLASALSKYVVKKGRFTVSPERCLSHAGLLPERPEGQEKQESNGVVVMGEQKWEDGATGDENGHGHVEEGLTAVVTPDALGKVVHFDEGAGPAGSTPGKPDAGAETAEWSWDQVEKERLRGLDLFKAWLALDGELLQEFSRIPGS